MKKKKWEDHEGVLCESRDGFDVIDCESCRFRHIIPLPSKEELENVYRDEYYSAEKPLYIERYLEDLDWWNLTYSERYDIFEEILPPARRRILDVGSGPGYFLLHGKQRGWETLGIEPSSQAASHSSGLGLDIVEDFLSEGTASGLGRFDVIHMSDVLEHVPDPAGLIRLSRSLLLPGGLFCVVVPNDFNPFQSALRDACGFDPWWVAPPHHINYFDHNSLKRLLVENGLEIVSLTSTFPIDMFLLMGQNYVGNDSLGRKCHQMRMSFEQNLEKAGMGELKIELYHALASLGLGREVFLIGRKK